jgi:hypothetical protein
MGGLWMKHLAEVVTLTLFVFLAVVWTGRSETNMSEQWARTFFTQFVELGQAFDPTLADLVVGPDTSGRWLIYEERNITKP